MLILGLLSGDGSYATVKFKDSLKKLIVADKVKGILSFSRGYASSRSYFLRYWGGKKS